MFCTNCRTDERSPDNAKIPDTLCLVSGIRYILLNSYSAHRLRSRAVLCIEIIKQLADRRMRITAD